MAALGSIPLPNPPPGRSDPDHGHGSGFMVFMDVDGPSMSMKNLGTLKKMAFSIYLDKLEYCTSLNSSAKEGDDSPY